MTEVSIVKLTSGVDVVGVILNMDDFTITISNPFEIMYNPQSDSITFVPLCFWSYDSEFTISTNQILFTASSMPLLAKRYNDVIIKTNKEDNTNVEESSDDIIESIFNDNYDEYEYDDFELNIELESNNILH